MSKLKMFFDSKDFIYKNRPSGKQKLYRIICDFCRKKTRYSSKVSSKAKNKKNYCRSCQYKKLSKEYSKQIVGKCEVCGKEISRTLSQWDRAETSTCSKKCTGIAKRKDVTEVARSHLKTKLLNHGGSEPKCVRCGHEHEWNLQVHHKKFVAHGGKSSWDNLEFLCRNCHGDIHNEKGKDIE